MARKRILLYIRHEGLCRILTDLWRDHFHISLFPGGHKREFRWLPIGSPKDADIIVSTLFHPELEFLAEKPDDKPVVAYATDMLGGPVRDLFAACAKKPWFHVVGCEPCYPDDRTWPCEEYITYAVKPIRFKTKYTGMHPKIAVVNKVPEVRWQQAQRRAASHHQPGTETSVTLEELFQDIPWTRVQSPNWNYMWQDAMNYRAMFQFGNTPYNCVMFEAMHLGIPMVGYNDHWRDDYNPIEHYLHEYSTDPEVIRKMLRERLTSPPSPPVEYPAPSFQEIQNRWVAYFESLL